MKKHKRNPEHRCFVKGYQAAIQGRSLSGCPHQENSLMSFHWSRGWREAREDVCLVSMSKPANKKSLI